MQSVASPKAAKENVPDTLPFSLPLELNVTDPEVVSELFAKKEGRERDDYALGALRLGVLALCQARGQIDSNTLKHEGERLLGDVQLALSVRSVGCCTGSPATWELLVDRSSPCDAVSVVRSRLALLP
jgi:hypothetical protein